MRGVWDELLSDQLSDYEVEDGHTTAHDHLHSSRSGRELGRAPDLLSHRRGHRFEPSTAHRKVPCRDPLRIAVGAHLLVQQRVGVGLADWAGCLAVCWVPSGVRGCRCIRALERSK
jgi:hypothetical protein